MNRAFILTVLVLTGVGLATTLPAWRLNADEPKPFRQGERPEGFRGRGRPGMGSPEGSAMRDQVLQRFDEMLDRLTRIERRLESRRPEEAGRPGPRSAEGGEPGRGPRPPRPEWMGNGGEGFRPRAEMPRGPRRPGGRFGGMPGALDRSELPEEVRERIEERMQQGRQRMEEVRERMAAAREKFLEMQERIERLEAEVERLKKTADTAGEG